MLKSEGCIRLSYIKMISIINTSTTKIVHACVTPTYFTASKHKHTHMTIHIHKHCHILKSTQDVLKCLHSDL